MIAKHRHNTTRPIARRSRRSGVAMVESAFVLSILLTVLLLIVDLGLAVLNYNTLSAAARRTARAAVVRGEQAAKKGTSWGPDSYQATAADSSEIAAVVRSSLATNSPDDVSVEVEWPDGGHRIDQRVRVKLRYRYTPILPVPGVDYYDLTAVSTMKIVH